MKKTLEPELRFPEFSGEWEDEKLSAIVDRVTTRNSNNESDHVLTISAEMGLIDQEEYFNKRVASKDLKNYYLIYKNSFAYNKSYSNGYPYGVIKRLNRYEKGVLSSLYICFKSKYDNHIYLEHYFQSSKWYKEIYKIAVEGARNHGLLNIGIQDFFDIGIKHPQLEEQEKIANFFTLIDKKTEKQKEKIAKLEDYKKGMTQKLFPKKEESIPELRFRGFTDPWEHRKLSDLGDIITGSTPKTSDSSNYGGEFLFVSPADIQGNRYIKSTNTNLTRKGFNSGRHVREGASLFVSIGSTIGKVAQSIEILTSNQQINALVPYDDYCDDFVFSLLETQSDKIKAIASNQAVPIVNKTTFGQTKVIIPKVKDEQFLIGEYFKKLDNLIALHHSKLEELKELKKGFMQKMFI